MNKIGQFSIAVLLLFTGCEQIDKLLTDKTNQPVKKMQLPPQIVDTMILKKEDVGIDYEYPARIISDEDVQIKAKVAGELVKKYFKDGQKVKKGDLLFSIDPTVYKAKYEVQAANEQVALANLSQAQKDFTRIQNLYKKNATSQKTYDLSYSALQIAKASLSQAQALKNSAKIDYDYTQIKAPFDGYLSDSFVDNGEFINIGMPLIRITKTSTVYAEFFIPDVDRFNQVENVKNNLWSKINTHVNIKYSNKTYNGKITYIDKNIDQTNGTVKAKAKFKNENNELVVGSFASLHVNNFTQKNAFKIPKIALVQSLAKTMVYIATPLPKKEGSENNKMIPNAKITAVEIDSKYESGTFVLANTDKIKQGDLLIINNFKKVRADSLVHVQSSLEFNKLELK